MRIALLEDQNSVKARQASARTSLRISASTVEAASASLDCLAILAASFFGQFFYGFMSRARAEDFVVACGVGVLACMTHVLISHAWGQYRLSVLTTPMRHLRRTIAISAVLGLALTAVLFLLKTGDNFSRGALIVFLAVESVSMIALRMLQGVAVRGLMLRGAICGSPVFIVGEAQELSRLTSKSLLFHFGQREVGRMLLSRDGNEEDRLREAIELARQAGAQAFSLAVDWSDALRLNTVKQALRMSPLAVHLLPDHRTRVVLERHARLSTTRHMQVMLQRAPLSGIELAAKRALDFTLALVALAVLSPLLLLVALLIKLDSPGPALFKQYRRGFNQKPFVIYKFRSMTVQENGETVTQASRNDARVTRIGRFLRRSSIDEVPQLINVLQGSMSLVGPRPHAVVHDDHYGQKIDNYCVRHHVKPGITGWAQVNGVRGETVQIEDMQARVELDIWYVNHWSPFLDLTILFRTCFTVLGHDAY